MQKTKKCVECEETKKLTQFPKHRAGTEGRTTKCKTCKAAQEKIYRTKMSEIQRKSSPHIKALQAESYAIEEKIRKLPKTKIATITKLKNQYKNIMGELTDIFQGIAV